MSLVVDHKLLAGCGRNKVTMHKTKFETDQKKRLDELVKKRKAEDKRNDLTQLKKWKVQLQKLLHSYYPSIPAVFHSTCSG
jgi:ArsR family metal-binding transcriptional regulator